MKIFYRTSDSGYSKVKPDYVNPKNCLNNFLATFPTAELTIIADNVSDETFSKLETLKPIGVKDVLRTNAGSSAGGFNLALDLALKGTDDNEIIYLVENDFIHMPGAEELLQEVFDELNPEYASLYDHIDKYLPMYQGGEPTRVFNSKTCHWKLTVSTVMTFASRLKTLREDEPILRQFTSGMYPQDHDMFKALRAKGRSLITPLPSYSTHGETAWLAPHRNWKVIMEKTQFPFEALGKQIAEKV